MLIGNRVCVKSSGLAPGLANARSPGGAKKCLAVARGGGGRGDWAQLELTALILGEEQYGFF